MFSIVKQTLVTLLEVSESVELGVGESGRVGVGESEASDVDMVDEVGRS